MLENWKDPGAPLEALGTLRTRWNWNQGGLRQQRGSWERRGRRESSEIRDPKFLPADTVLMDYGNLKGKDLFVPSSRPPVYTGESAPRKSITSRD